MITIDGVQYRNLEEQVKKNKDDIQYILEEEGVLNQFGIKIVGEVDTSTDLPDPTTYEGEFGDAYAVGTTTPYTLYIFTRANGEHPTNYWFNIGQFPLPGPTGAQGPAGEDGATGLPALQDMGHRTTSTVPIIGMALGTAASNFNRQPVVGDTFFQLVLGLDGTSAEGRTWITNNEITSVGSLSNYRVSSVLETTGAQGPQGNPGVQGEKGPQGVQGPIGPQGNPGQSFIIQDVLSSASLLPDPTTVPDNVAYLVGLSSPYDLYVQLQSVAEWFNAGIVEGVQGPQGPQGPAVPLVSERGTSDLVAISQNGIEKIFFSKNVELGSNISSLVPINDNGSSVMIGYRLNANMNTSSGTDTLPIAIGKDISVTSSDTTEPITQPSGIYIGIGNDIKANIGSSVAMNTIGIGGGIESDGINNIIMGFGSNVKAKRAISIGGGDIDVGSDNSLAIIGNIDDNSSSCIAIGQAARVGSNCNHAVAIRGNVGKNSSYSVAIGYSSNVKNDSSSGVAIGPRANVGNSSSYSVAIGYSADTLSTYAISIGANACVGANCNNSVAIGYNSVISGNKPNCVAIGPRVRMLFSGVNNIIAMGSNIIVRDDGLGTPVENSIILGSDIITDTSTLPLSNCFCIDDTPIYDRVNKKIISEVIPDGKYFNRVVYTDNGQYMTFGYSSLANSNGVNTLSPIATDLTGVNATSVETMIPASGMYNGKQVVGVYGSGNDINITFQDGTGEVMSAMGTVTVSA